MRLLDVSNALLTVTSRVYRYTAISSPVFPYIVYADEMESGSLSGDGRKVGRILEGSIDLYSKRPDDPFINAIEKALNDAGICFRLNSIQYEPDTKVIHHEWVFEIETDVS